MLPKITYNNCNAKTNENAHTSKLKQFVLESAGHI